MPLCGRASPSYAVSRPAMILSSDDLPAPLSPSTPILAPGKNDRLMSRRMTRLGATTLDTRFIVKMYWAMGCKGLWARPARLAMGQGGGVRLRQMSGSVAVVVSERLA